MNEIRSLANDCAGEERIAPVRIVERRALNPSSEITRAFNNLRSHAPLGTQYEWLAAFLAHENLIGMELAIHQDDKATRFINGQAGLREDVDIIFGAFRFPLLKMTKMKMRDKAIANDFLDLLEMSWFCHRNGKVPCGLCSPCRDAIDEGMGYRLPISSHIKYHLRHLIRPIEQLIRWVGRRLGQR